MANKSEFGRMAMQQQQQRMQQNMAGPSSNSENQIPQGSQSAGGGGVQSHDGGGNSQGQEPERTSVPEGNVLGGNEQNLQQNPSAMTEGGQNAIRRNYAMGLVASAASAFDAAKDIMEALRSKHTNLASELEVKTKKKQKRISSTFVFEFDVNSHYYPCNITEFANGDWFEICDTT